MADREGRDHIVKVPSWFKFLVAAKIVVAAAVLGLGAYGATFHDWFGGNGYAIFCAVTIFLTEGYYLVSTLLVPNAYNCWAYLVFSVFQVIWWLACWADLAIWAASYDITIGGLNLGDVMEYSYDCTLDEETLEWTCPTKYNRKKHRNVIAAAAGVSALEWILVIVSLVVFAIHVLRHRRSGAPYAANGGWRTTPQNPRGIPGGAEAQNEQGKGPMQQPQIYQMYPQQQDAYAGQQPVYQQPQQAYQGYVV